jgi:hypothetical protein
VAIFYYEVYEVDSYTAVAMRSGVLLLEKSIGKLRFSFRAQFKEMKKNGELSKLCWNLSGQIDCSIIPLFT